MGPPPNIQAKLSINLTRLPRKDKPDKDFTGVNLTGAIT